MTDTKRSLPKGIYPQIYRDAIHGDKYKLLNDKLDEFKQLGLPGVFFHMFPSEQNLVSEFKKLAKLASDRGLLACVAFGLDSPRMTPIEKGRAVGSVAVLSECFCVSLNVESFWDSGKAADAIAMCEEIKRIAPNSFLIDQPWPVPSVHSKFPWLEFAKYVEARAPQFYYNNWKAQHGRDRYEFCDDWFSKEWDKLESKKLAPAGLAKQRIVTLQGYAWDDVIDDLVTCLLKYPVVVMWSEPFPTESTVRGIKAVGALAAAGCTGPRAVWDYQHKMGLDMDGMCGPNTLARLAV